MQGTYGEGCNHICACSGGTCDPQSGACTCPNPGQGNHGNDCQEGCPRGKQNLPQGIESEHDTVLL